MENNICYCGHEKMYHFKCDCEEHTRTSYVCQVCAESGKDFSMNCEHEFKPDNLKFLEKLDGSN
jgi:hypothetical protein